MSDQQDTIEQEEGDVVHDEATWKETEGVLHPSPDADNDFNPFSEYHDAVQFGPLQQVQGPDGVFSTHVPEEQTRRDIPPLSKETLICMGDFSEFVIRDPKGRIRIRVKVEDVIKAPNGSYFIPKSLAENEKYLAEQLDLVADEDWYEDAPLEPLRPPCKHYIRQAVQFEHNPEHKSVARLCAARRTTEGTMASVRDMAIWACDMRVPRDLESEKKHLDVFDEMKEAQGRENAAFSMFKK